MEDVTQNPWKWLTSLFLPTFFFFRHPHWSKHPLARFRGNAHLSRTVGFSAYDQWTHPWKQALFTRYLIQGDPVIVKGRWPDHLFHLLLSSLSSSASSPSCSSCRVPSATRQYAVQRGLRTIPQKACGEPLAHDTHPGKRRFHFEHAC